LAQEYEKIDHKIYEILIPTTEIEGIFGDLVYVEHSTIHILNQIRNNWNKE